MNYDSFILIGIALSAWRVGRLLETVSCQVNAPKPRLAYIDLLNEEYYDFTKSYWHKVSRKFYTLPEHYSMVKCALELSYIGRSSFQLQVTVVKDGDILAISRYSDSFF